MEIPEKLKLEYLLALDNHIETVGKENKEVTLKKFLKLLEILPILDLVKKIYMQLQKMKIFTLDMKNGENLTKYNYYDMQEL